MFSKRCCIAITGSVQGVGFRPFIYRLALCYSLSGTIRNTNSGVLIDIQGAPKAISDFEQAIISQKPARAIISEIESHELPLHELKSFNIIESDQSNSLDLPLIPDTAICPDCLAELFDPQNRRYLYPFTHCISCGPRFSLFLQMPFDRINTTMKSFAMCTECCKEYDDPANRRFFSQTNCCPDCGPKISLVDRFNNILANGYAAINVAIEYLQQGKIVSIKNTGGHQLLADAQNEPAIQRLRMRKNRASKPFAMLMPSLAKIKEHAILEGIAEQVLTSPAAPIVLLNKISSASEIAPSVASESPYFGIMLPHNAIQHMILRKFETPLVATSGNLSDGPLCIDNEDALAKLSNIADVFLLNDRQIIHALDDSVVQIIGDRPMLVRRARGYIPFSIPLPSPASQVTFAAGGQLKNTFAFAKGKQIYISQHIGNLDSASTSVAYDKTIEKWEKLLNITPSSAAADKHPRYYSTDYTFRRQIPFNQVQHHKAHVLAGMLDNQLHPPLLAIAWDGTGYGDDETIWGGEAFLVEDNKMTRFATLYPFKLPGGETAIREPRRCALGLLHAIWGDQMPEEYQNWLEKIFNFRELHLLFQALSKGLNTPSCTSMGRLFDGISALLGCCMISQFEGHAAISVEAISRPNTRIHYSIPLLNDGEKWILDWRPLVQEIFSHIHQSIDIGEIAFAFHSALADSIVNIAHKAGQNKVLLTGGVMQNKLLAEQAITKLRSQSFTPYWHQNIPPNDGGIAPGQIVGASPLHPTKGRRPLDPV